MSRSPDKTPPFRTVLLDGPDDPFFARFSTDCANVFMSRGFLKSVADNLLRPEDALVLVGVTDASDAPVALFPFVRRRRLGATVVEGLDFGVADYFAPCLGRGLELDAAGADRLWRDVLRVLPAADAVTFKKMPRLLYGVPHALTAATFVAPMAASATTLPLYNDDGSGITPPSSLIKEIKRKSRKLESLGKVEFRLAETPEEIGAALDGIVELRRARFADMQRRDVMMYDEVVAFYRDLAMPAQGEPVGRIFTLRAGDRTIAAVFALTYRGVFILVVPAMTNDPSLRTSSPGLVAFVNAMEWSREQGYRFFDLSVGSLHYKSRFGAQTVELFEYQKALTLRGRIVVLDAWLRRTGRREAISRPWIRETADALGRYRMRARAMFSR